MLFAANWKPLKCGVYSCFLPVARQKHKHAYCKEAGLDMGFESQSPEPFQTSETKLLNWLTDDTHKKSII